MPYRPFTPKEEQLALLPEISGNTINGLGEMEFRRATHVYWFDPDKHPHGKLQQWFYTQNADHAGINSAREARAKIHAIEVPPVSGEPLELAPHEWTRDLKAHAESLDFELIGVTEMRQEWVFEGFDIPQTRIIMIGVAHDYDEIKKAPDNDAGAEVIRQYGRAAQGATDIATWIRQRGWDAEPFGGPMAGKLLMIPPAIECGLGKLGKHGSIINDKYGSSFRLAAVLTDVPFAPSKPATYDVDDFCSRCQVCANACPPDAILPEKTMVRGELKWYVDFDKCITFFNETSGCGICIAVCPWSIPGRGPRIIEQLQRRAARIAAS